MNSIYKLINQSEQVFEDRHVPFFGDKRVLSAKLEFLLTMQAHNPYIGNKSRYSQVV